MGQSLLLGWLMRFAEGPAGTAGRLSMVSRCRAGGKGRLPGAGSTLT